METLPVNNNFIPILNFENDVQSLFPSPLFNACPSSITTQSHLVHFANVFGSFLKVSYVVMTTWVLRSPFEANSSYSSMIERDFLSPLYATVRSSGAHFSNSRNPVDHSRRSSVEVERSKEREDEGKLTIRNERVGNDDQERSSFLDQIEVREETNALSRLAETLRCE